jgi:segregation and condensation protein A
MAEKWQGQEDPVAASDEVPVTAWIVRRKVEMTLPGLAPETPESTDGEGLDVAVDGSLGEWIPRALVELVNLQRESQLSHFRPRAEWPTALHPVRGASLSGLSDAWPRVIRAPSPRPTTVKREVDPLAQRLAVWRSWLSARPMVAFPAPELARRETVGMFVALLALWSEGEVAIAQPHPFARLEVQRVELGARG